jgi:ATP-binding protein involved in chromosome partitioning
MRRAARLAAACAPRLASRPSLRRLAHAADPYGARAPLPGVAHCVAVASGKGGVGKSTTAVNLAVAARALGLRVALLDADVYGPSLPLLMGLPSGVPPRLDAAKRMLPPVAHGVPVMSMGLLLKGAAARSAPRQHALRHGLTVRARAWPPASLAAQRAPPRRGGARW